MTLIVMSNLLFFSGSPWGPAGGIAPFYAVPLKPFSTRTQCPDDTAIEKMMRKKLDE
jgi:hypothetical protein